MCTRESTDPPQPEDDRMTYEMVDLNYEHRECTTDEGPCVTMNFIYPRFQGDSTLADSLQSWTDYKIHDVESDSELVDTDELALEWFSDYDQFALQIDGYNISWSLERRVELVYQSENLVSLHFNEFSFTGGAHAMQLDVFRSFDRPGGNRITLSDLTYTEELFEQLERQAEEQFRFTYELLEKDEAGEADYTFLDGEFYLPDNFAFTDFGLLFYYNVYDIAPHATRPIAIELPYENIESVIRARWLQDKEHLIRL